MAKMKVQLMLLFILSQASPSFAEYIFRGQCTSILQPQEVAITVDTNDLAFGLYVIPPRNQPSPSPEQCIESCLATSKPAACRSAIFDPNQQACWLLRADKQTALEFDTRSNATSTLSGILIAPQALMDQVSDRRSGVPNCDSFCPAPAEQTENSIVPVCLQDCPNAQPVCAGELAGCFDFGRRVIVEQPNTFWHLGGVTIMRTFTVQKKFDYTSMRFTLHFGGWVFRPGTSSVGYWNEGYIYVWINGQNCGGEANQMQIVGREMLESYRGYESGEPMHNEFVCTQFDQPTGNLEVRIYYDYRNWGSYFGSAQAPGTTMAGVNAPIMFMAEEYIPARTTYFKLDDSARCQSSTVFNTATQQWTSSWGSLNSRTHYVMWKYKKRSDTSALRIHFSANLYIDAFRKCIHLYFTINDQLCQNPFSIETIHREFNYGSSSDRTSPDTVTASLDGICRGLPAGRYDIALWADSACPYFADQNEWWGWNLGRGRPSQMLVEEINEGLPINAILSSDGSMIQLPYFNRQYFVFTTGCEGTGAHACFNPITSMTYKKLREDSSLHVKWYGTQEYCTDGYGSWSELIRWYIKLNGAECNNPLKLESWWFNSNTPPGYCKTRAKYVEGVCKMAIPAGDVSISLLIGQAVSGWGTMSRKYGATIGGTSYLMVEEMYDGAI